MVVLRCFRGQRRYLDAEQSFDLGGAREFVPLNWQGKTAMTVELCISGTPDETWPTY